MRIHQHEMDPFLRPDWRYERILSMIDRQPSPGRCTRKDDRYIRTARSFVLRWRNGDEATRDQLEQEFPALYYAWKIFDGDEGLHPNTRFIIESRLLGQQSLDRIAHSVGSKPEVIQWFERSFFNVWSRITATDWIAEMVLNPAADRMIEQIVADKVTKSDSGFQRFVTPPVIRPDYDFSCKMLCYFGGPHLCDIVLHHFQPGQHARTVDGVPEWFDESMMNVLRKRATQAMTKFEVNKYNVTELFSLHMQIIQLARTADAVSGKQTGLEQGVHAMIRSVPFRVGRQVSEEIADTPLGEYEGMQAELRADEMMLVQAGTGASFEEDLGDLAFPKERRN